MEQERLGRLEAEARDLRNTQTTGFAATWTAIHDLRNWQAGAVAREEARIESMRRLDALLDDMRQEVRTQIREMRESSDRTLRDIRENMVTKDQNKPIAAVVYLAAGTLGAAILGAIWKFFIQPPGSTL